MKKTSARADRGGDRGGGVELPNELKVYDGRLAALALVALPLAALLARRRGKGGAACDV